MVTADLRVWRPFRHGDCRPPGLEAVPGGTGAEVWHQEVCVCCVLLGVHTLGDSRVSGVEEST